MRRVSILHKFLKFNIVNVKSKAAWRTVSADTVPNFVNLSGFAVNRSGWHTAKNDIYESHGL